MKFCLWRMFGFISSIQYFDDMWNRDTCKCDRFVDFVNATQVFQIMADLYGLNRSFIPIFSSSKCMHTLNKHYYIIFKHYSIAFSTQIMSAQSRFWKKYLFCNNVPTKKAEAGSSLLRFELFFLNVQFLMISCSDFPAFLSGFKVVSKFICFNLIKSNLCFSVED